MSIRFFKMQVWLSKWQNKKSLYCHKVGAVPRARPCGAHSHHKSMTPPSASVRRYLYNLVHTQHDSVWMCEGDNVGAVPCAHPYGASCPPDALARPRIPSTPRTSLLRSDLRGYRNSVLQTRTPPPPIWPHATKLKKLPRKNILQGNETTE